MCRVVKPTDIGIQADEGEQTREKVAVTSGKPIVVFDGVCNFCSRGVQFILKNDRSGELRFTPIQSATGKTMLEERGISSIDPSTFLFVRDGEAFTKSDAAIEIARYLGPWRFLRILRFVPRTVRDLVYGCVARNRYKWFGKRNSCYLPTSEERSKFIEV